MSLLYWVLCMIFSCLLFLIIMIWILCPQHFLRWNSYNIKLTILSCTSPWHWYTHKVGQPLPLWLQSIFITHQGDLIPSHCPSTYERINKMWGFHIMNYYSVRKRSKVLTHATPWMHLWLFLIIIHRECEGFQDLAFAESVWKMEQNGRDSWEPIGLMSVPQPMALSTRGEVFSAAIHPASWKDRVLGFVLLSEVCGAWTSDYSPADPRRVSGLWMFPRIVEDGVWIPHSHSSWFWMMFKRPKWQHHFYPAVFLRIAA